MSGVLVCPAPPDDIGLGRAGTIAKLVKQGDRVCYAICTSGEKGLKSQIPEEEKKAVREQEQQAAATLLQVHEVRFLRQRDGEVVNNHAFRIELVKLLRDFKPDIVFSPDPANALFNNFYRYHHDHRELAEAVFDAIYPATGNPLYFPELDRTGFKPHHVAQVYFYGTDFPDHWEDISEEMELKVEALCCHSSQIAEPEQIATMIRQRQAEAGKARRMAYAETFRVLEVPT